MNLGEVKSRVKRQFGDEAQVQISDVDIIRWVNDGQRHIVMHNNNLNRRITVGTLYKDQADYLLPENLFNLNSISVKNTNSLSYFHIKGVSKFEFDQNINGWDGTAVSGSSTPYLYFKFGQSISLFPTPNSNVVDGLKIDYARFSDDLANNDDVIDLPIEYHSAIVDYCLQQAYELDEDWQASAAKAGQVQNTLHVNRNRENDGAKESYSSITTMPDDAW
jgi:hypothetical protein